MAVRQDLDQQLRDALKDPRAEGDLRDYMQTAAEGLSILGPNGTILWANQAELDLLGYTGDDYVGHLVGEFHADSDVVARLLDVLRQGGVVRDIEARLRCKDRSTKTVLINAKGLWQDGQLIHSLCCTRDVSARREATETRQRLAAIVDSSEDAIVSKDLNGIVTSWNASAERIFGYSAAEMIGHSINQIIPLDRLADADMVLERIRNGEAVRHFETVRRRKDGSLVPVSITVSPIRDDRNEIIGASKIARDISERIRHEHDREELLARAEQARTEAERANHVKDEFLATLSHELRSPLNAISGWAQLAAGQVEESKSPTVRRAFEVIERNVALQLRLINDLLDVSSILNGKLQLRTDVVDITAIVEAVVEGVRPQAKARGIVIEWRASGGRPSVIGDAARLQQIVANLMANALKFTPFDGVVTVTLSVDDQTVRIAVRDTGEGISPEFLPQVFDSFRQADPRTTTRSYGGLGLGLAVVHHLVAAHGGQVTAESAGIGQGSTFVVELPVASATIDQAEPAADQHHVPLAGLRLLVVDDDEDARGLLDAMLQRHHADVRTAASMAEALGMLQSRRFDILLSDLAMPRHDGYELIEVVRHDARPVVSEIGAIAVTAHADGPHRNRAMASGFDDHVTKPVDADRLVRVIERVAERRMARRRR